ncbi:MAG TPA: DUF423 domain-containing protein [Gammaproteobacteria bacterium]|nr:DUF423 domain-containing protein [Gammaproteobacteria bacterium]
MKNWILFVAGLGGAAGVTAGALGSHALKLDPQSQAGHIYHLAVSYLLLHAVALCALAAYRAQQPRASLPLTIAAILFTAGMLLFSGSLIVSIAADWPAIRVSAPWGGSSMIAGWIAVIVAGMRMKIAAD